MADERDDTTDGDRVVALGDFGDQFTADLIASKLRAYGIQAQAQPATVRGGLRLSSGNIVWVFARDLDDAREIATPE